MVVYVTPDSTHGLIAATQDQSSTGITWFDGQDSVNNPINHNAEGKKFVDWRLPTKTELLLLYQMRATIGGFNDYYYWSSTFIVSTTYAEAYNYHFADGTLHSNGVYSLYNVRAVRTF
jgi:hypothetical protein